MLMAWKSTHAFFPLGSILIVLVWQGISVAYLEVGAYSPELMVETHRSGATFRYVIAICNFILAYWITMRFIVSPAWLGRMDRFEERMVQAARWALPLILASLAAVLLLLLKAPREAVDSRSQYLMLNPDLLRDTLLTYQPLTTLVLGIGTGLARNEKVRTVGICTFIAMIVTMYVYGNKFSEIAETLFYFCTPLAALMRFYPMDRRILGMNLRRQALVIGTIFCFAVTSGIIRQANYLSTTGADAQGSQYLMERVFILQGGIFWSTDNDAIHGKYQPGLREFATFVRDVDYHQDSSLMYLMSRAIGYDLTYKIFTIDNSLFTGAFPAIFYVIGGRYGPFYLCLVIGAGIALITGYCIRKLLSGQVALAIVAFSVFLPIQSLASGAEFTPLLSKGLAAKLVILVVLEAYEMHKRAVKAESPKEAV